MDAEELSEVKARDLTPAECGAGSAGGTACPANRCGLSCSLKVIQSLLGDGELISGEEADLLLDLHQLIKSRVEAEAALKVFCELRRRLESRKYLAFYRLRRWLEAHLIAELRVPRNSDPQQLPVRLNGYCVEAIRRFCLCAGLAIGAGGPRARLSFKFQPV